MKKIFFLLFICLIKLSAYEYIIYNFEYAIGSHTKYIYYYDNNNKLMCDYVDADGNITNKINLNIATTIYAHLGNIKYLQNSGYVTSEIFDSYYKNDLIFLNDLYLYVRNAFLNYLYNNSDFGANKHINYDNYELFYNEDGLVVESKVDGVYKGLYDDIGQSGILYNSIGEVVLVNGVEPSFLTKQWLKLQNKIINPLLSVFSISNIWKNILCVVVILASFRMIIRYAFKAFLIRLYSKRIKHYENTITRIENA